VTNENSSPTRNWEKEKGLGATDDNDEILPLLLLGG
jgi:hypothetical protein